MLLHLRNGIKLGSRLPAIYVAASLVRVHLVLLDLRNGIMLGSGLPAAYVAASRVHFLVVLLEVLRCVELCSA